MDEPEHTPIPPPSVTTFYCRWLGFLLGLFCLRVLGQLLVAYARVDFLPPMEEWYSGAVAYPRLLFSQILIIVLAGTVCAQLRRGMGACARPRRALGVVLLFFGSVYLAVMVIRYGVRMSLYAPERWAGGSIPIFFHWVLAAFVLMYGRYHQRYAAPAAHPRRVRAGLALAGVMAGASVLAWAVYMIAPAVLAHALNAPAPRFAVRVHRAVPVTTSDGVRLAADIYRPRRADPTPTILVRLPYSKTLRNTLFARTIGRMWAEHGYTVVIQGTRGRYESGGTYYPLTTERRDGLDTLAWLARQHWFDGRLGMWGGSYFGYTQWVLADQERPG